MKRILSKEQVEEAKAMHYNGKSFKEIADIYGVTRQCIQQRIAYKRKNRHVPFKDQITKLKEENNFLRKLIRKHGIDMKDEELI